MTWSTAVWLQWRTFLITGHKRYYLFSMYIVVSSVNRVCFFLYRPYRFYLFFSPLFSGVSLQPHWVKVGWLEFPCVSPVLKRNLQNFLHLLWGLVWLWGHFSAEQFAFPVFAMVSRGDADHPLLVWWCHKFHFVDRCAHVWNGCREPCFFSSVRGGSTAATSLCSVFPMVHCSSSFSLLASCVLLFYIECLKTFYIWVLLFYPFRTLMTF